MKVPKTALIFLAVFFVGCRSAPVPSEVLEANTQEQELWRAGASIYFSGEFDAYAAALKAARQELRQENLKLGWFRNYRFIQDAFRGVLEEGQDIYGKLEAFKESRRTAIQEASRAAQRKVGSLNDITLSLGERGLGRQGLTQAGIYLKEGESLLLQGRYEEAAAKITAAGEAARKAETAVIAHIGRYLDERQVEVWRRWAEETIADSRKKGTLAIIVSKLERKLTIYRKGQPVRTYDVGLGFDGLSTKVRSGDNATPEGKYRVIRKNPRSLYYKALLIDYPNDEDRKRFAQAKKEGTIPANALIGGDIEIHGGGKDSLTRGCVSLDNDKMDEVYELAGIGTPVTIIGTLELDNFVLRAIRDE